MVMEPRLLNCCPGGENWRVVRLDNHEYFVYWRPHDTDANKTVMSELHDMHACPGCGTAFEKADSSAPWMMPDRIAHHMQAKIKQIKEAEAEHAATGG